MEFPASLLTPAPTSPVMGRWRKKSQGKKDDLLERGNTALSISSGCQLHLQSHEGENPTRKHKCETRKLNKKSIKNQKYCIDVVALIVSSKSCIVEIRTSFLKRKFKTLASVHVWLSIRLFPAVASEEEEEEDG